MLKNTKMKTSKKIIIFIFILSIIFNVKLISSNNDEDIPVVIIHGILSNPLVMKPLENKFQEAGYKTYNYGYHSTRENIHQQGIDFSKWVL